MKFGACTGWEHIDAAARAGFDYIEISLTNLALLPEKDFSSLLAASKHFPIPVLKSNGFIPKEIPVVGPDREEATIRSYIRKALSRGAALGLETAVFGSSAARRVPDGYSRDQAIAEFSRALLWAAQTGSEYGVAVAIEPLCRAECNLLNTVEDAVTVANRISHPNLYVLGDTYHMEQAQEPLSIFTKAGKLLRHVHISHPLPGYKGRNYPSPADDTDYAAVFEALRRADYQGDVSIEAGVKDLESEGRAALLVLKQYV